jgi:hypothetical protein
VSAAENIAIRNCQLDNIGSYQLATPFAASKAQREAVGTYALSVRFSEAVIIQNNTTNNVWNTLHPGLQQGSKQHAIAAGTPELIHHVYFGEVGDVFFLSNTFRNTSGASLKFDYSSIMKKRGGAERCLITRPSVGALETWQHMGSPWCVTMAPAFVEKMWGPDQIEDPCCHSIPQIESCEANLRAYVRSLATGSGSR